ncbi:Hph [Trypoxylus dichotomus]
MESENRTNNYSVERHYRIASTAYDTMEEIMNGIKTEFRASFQCIKEVLIIFGTTLYTAKEVFQINLPILQGNHIEANHLKSIPKNQQKILRHIFLSQDWLKAMENVCPTTNITICIRGLEHGRDTRLLYTVGSANAEN